MARRPSYPVARLDYDLPLELIAQQPLPERAGSRMLYVNAAEGRLEDRHFDELESILPAGTLIVFNNSRVIPARIIGKRVEMAEGQGGGAVEVLFHRWLGDGVCEAVVGSSSKLAAGELIELPGGWFCILLEPKQLDGVRVRYLDSTRQVAPLESLLAYLNVHGQTPLPPYIKRQTDDYVEDPELAATDYDRYQTVYAMEDGSVAAPTAGLHFNKQMMARLKQSGHRVRMVTLHVGLGTFAPVRASDLSEHRMHTEAYSLEVELAREYLASLEGESPVLAVGTTSLRVLNTLCEGMRDWPAGEEQIHGVTKSFIYPGHGTDASNMLLTNFHLPRSTLLALVYAFGGEELMRSAYRHAVEQRYRFFSYGDCMFIDRRKSQ